MLAGIPPEVIVLTRRKEAVLAILSERGPLTPEQIGPELLARGATRARDPVASARGVLRVGSDLVELADGRWLSLGAALDGAVLPHRVTQQERDRCCLRLDPDLTVLASMIGDDLIQPASGYAHIVVDSIRDDRLDASGATPDRFLALPFGFGRRLVPGSPIMVHVTGRTFDIRTTEDPFTSSPDLEATMERVAATLLDRHRLWYDRRAVSVDELLVEAVAVMPDILRLLSEPVGSMLKRCGLVTHRDLVGTPHSDWDRLAHEAAVWRLVSRWDWESPEGPTDDDRWTWADEAQAEGKVD